MPPGGEAVVVGAVAEGLSPGGLSLVGGSFAGLPTVDSSPGSLQADMIRNINKIGKKNFFFIVNSLLNRK